VKACGAGTPSSGPIASFRKTRSFWVDINLTGVWHTAKAAIPHLRAGKRGGSIVITSSGAGLMGLPNGIHYASAKHGLVGMMRTLAIELAGDLIRVNSIHPTQVNTDMIHNDRTYELFMPDPANRGPELFEKLSTAMNLLPVPWVEPIDISNALLFLVSDDARYITGVPLPVDAGILLQ
jgi:(+)-trans-carveol dehydrogenase